MAALERGQGIDKLLLFLGQEPEAAMGQSIFRIQFECFPECGLRLGIFPTDEKIQAEFMVDLGTFRPKGHSRLVVSSPVLKRLPRAHCERSRKLKGDPEVGRVPPLSSAQK